MGKVPDIKRITVEDFDKDDRNLVEKLAFIINSFHEQVRSVLSKNVDFENLNQEIKTVSFTTNAQGQPINQVSFKSQMSSKVRGIIPVRTVITSNALQFADKNPVISWSQNGNVVTILSIGGLNPETKYELTILTI